MLEPDRQISEGTKKLIVEGKSGGLLSCFSTPRGLIALCIGSLPYSLMLLTYIGAPSYVAPIFRNATASTLLLIMATLNGLGCLWMSKTSNPVVWIFVILFLVAPLAVFPMIGPALLTILQAMGGIS